MHRNMGDTQDGRGMGIPSHGCPQNAFNEMNRTVMLWVLRPEERAAASIATNIMHSLLIMEP